MGVSTPSPSYEILQRKRNLTESLMEGVEAMRAAARARCWMWPGPGELRPSAVGEPVFATGFENLKPRAGAPGSKTKYDLRILESYLQNHWRDGVEGIAAMPFRSPAKVEGWNPLLQGVHEDGKLTERGWIHNIDGAGRTMRQVLHSGYLGATAHGMSWIVIELPRAPDAPRSIGEDRAAGFAPYWLDLAASDVLETVVSYATGAPRLEILRFRRTVFDRDETLAWRPQTEARETVKIYYAGDPNAKGDDARVHVEFYDDVSSDKPLETYPVIPISGSLSEIPAVPIYSYAGYKEPYCAEPALYDLAEAQAAHWRKLSRHDLRAKNIATSILFQSGINPEDPDSASNAGGSSMDEEGRLWCEDPGGDAKMVETSGAALEALREDLDRVRDHIREGMRQGAISKPLVARTATEIGVGEVRANSKVEADTIFLEGSAQTALLYTAILGGTSEIGQITLPVGHGLVGGNAEKVQEMLLDGGLTPDAALPELKRGGVFSDGFDVDEEVDRQNERRTLGEL